MEHVKLNIEITVSYAMAYGDDNTHLTVETLNDGFKVARDLFKAGACYIAIRHHEVYRARTIYRAHDITYRYNERGIVYAYKSTFDEEMLDFYSYDNAGIARRH